MEALDQEITDNLKNDSQQLTNATHSISIISIYSVVIVNYLNSMEIVY